MTITLVLGRGHICLATVQRRRAQVAAVITVLCLAAGCDDPGDAEFGGPDEQTLRDVEKCGIEKPAPGLVAPPGSYVDQGLAIDYARIGDEPYADKILADPRMFEQLYADAVSRQRDRALVGVPDRGHVARRGATGRGVAGRSALPDHRPLQLSIPKKLVVLRHHRLGRACAHGDRR